MDFELDDEQLELQRVVRDIAERECPPGLVRAVVDGSDDGRGLWKTVVQRPRATARSLVCVRSS